MHDALAQLRELVAARVQRRRRGGRVLAHAEVLDRAERVHRVRELREPVAQRRRPLLRVVYRAAELDAVENT